MPDIKFFPTLAILACQQDAVVDRRTHQNALHHQLGQIVIVVSLQSDRGDRQENAALNQQNQ